MTTTSELHSIIEELGLVDMGDAASYLGEEALESEELPCQSVSLLFLSPDENWENLLLSA